MNWRYKSLLQQAFSRIPYGEQLNYLCQRWVTKSLPKDDAQFLKWAQEAKVHIDVIVKHWGRSIETAVFYEFGAGWDLLGPMTFWALGAEQQIVIDKRRLFRSELINDVTEKFRRVPTGFPLRRKPTRGIKGGAQAVFSLADNYGIDYRAPCDAGHTGLASGSVDCITSTSTLEHIPVPNLRAILAECHRLLRDTGIASFSVDYDDHYSYFDSGISAWNFLRYSDRTWAPFNPPLQYQNRLRHRDYLEMIAAAGFAVIEERREKGTEADLETLKRVPLARCFTRFSLEELAVHKSRLVLRK